MYRRLLAVSLACLLMLAIGCGPTPEQRLVGDWEGQVILSESALAAQQNNPFAAAMGAAVQNMVANMRVTYELHADKTFDMELPSLVGSVKSSGTWEVVSAAGETITIRLNPDNAASIERAVTFTDADHFETSDDNGTLKFSRKTQS